MLMLPPGRIFPSHSQKGLLLSPCSTHL